jgi:hypothetical protein
MHFSTRPTQNRSSLSISHLQSLTSGARASRWLEHSS